MVGGIGGWLVVLWAFKQVIPGSSPVESNIIVFDQYFVQYFFGTFIENGQYFYWKLSKFNSYHATGPSYSYENRVWLPDLYSHSVEF